VALVVRVSTLRQADNDEGSLKNQLQRLRAHIDYKTIACGEQWTEASLYELRAVSGKHSLRSPEMLRLQRAIEEGRVDTVLCTALDRISRSVKDFLTFFEFLAEHDVEFVCLKQNYDTTTPQGRLFVTMMIALAQFEREQTAERTKDAVSARSERGLFNGGRLLGYDLDPNNKGHLLINEREAEAVRYAFEAYLECGSMVRTAELLNERGYRTKSFTSRGGRAHVGKPFQITGIQYLLKNPAYIGLKEIGKEAKRVKGDESGYRLVPAVWPPLIEKDIFDQVQGLMASNGQTRTNQAREHKHVYVLNPGLLWCGACGASMTGSSGTGRLGARSYYYVCPNDVCRLRVVADEIEGAVIERLGVLAGSPEILEPLVVATNLRLLRQLPALGKRRRALQRELADLKAQADRLLGSWEEMSSTDAGQAHQPCRASGRT
jgi:site-specific DNA recombinase